MTGCGERPRVFSAKGAASITSPPQHGFAVARRGKPKPQAIARMDESF